VTRSGEHGSSLFIRHDSDVTTAQIRAQKLARDEGLPEAPAAALATAVSELARNALVHAGSGEFHLRVTDEGGRRCIIAVVSDDGPGITDTERALEDGYSSTRTLGLGLPSARRLVDELDVVSIVGKGTTVTVKKWLP
jgi:serine/threonine-protein kinase RsbT